jgi:hypothetical protein
MSEDEGEAAQRAPPGRRALIWTVVVLIATLVALISESADLYKDLTAKRAQPAWARQAHAQIDADLSVIAVFDVRAQISERMNDCDYKLFVVCRTWEAECRDAGKTGLDYGVCVETHGGRQRPATPTERSVADAAAHGPSIVGLVLGSLAMLARFPDAAWQMLNARLAVSAVDFWMGALFVLIYVTLVVGALRLPGSMRFWGPIVAVLVGLDITYGLFWLALHAFAAAGDKAVDIAAMGLTGVGMPVCLGICIGHGASGFAEGLVRLARLVGIGARAVRG